MEFGKYSHPKLLINNNLPMKVLKIFYNDVPSTITLIVCIIGAVHYFDPKNFLFTASFIIFAAYVIVQLFRLNEAMRKAEYWKTKYLISKYQNS